MTDPAKQIARRNQERHAHHTDFPHCDRCGSFVTLGKPNRAGMIYYQCSVCGRAGLKHKSKTEHKEHATG